MPNILIGRAVDVTLPKLVALGEGEGERGYLGCPRADACACVSVCSSWLSLPYSQKRSGEERKIEDNLAVMPDSWKKGSRETFSKT